MSFKKEKKQPVTWVLGMHSCSHAAYPNIIDACTKITTLRIHGKPNLVKVHKSKQGKLSITGNSKRLKESAHYPLGFGLALAGLISPDGPPNPSFDRCCKIVLRYHAVFHIVSSIYQTAYIFVLAINLPSLEEIDITGDPDQNDDGALDDLLKGPSKCHWRHI